MVHHERLLELDPIDLFETSSQVGRYREQPPKILYPDGTWLWRNDADFKLLSRPYLRMGKVMPKHFWQGQWRGRSPAGDTHQRARNIITPSGGIVRGKFPSRKNGRMIHHEGLLELDAIYLFETSPQIARYREQPLTIHFPDAARLRRYTPDFELVTAEGEIVLVEIKPTRSLNADEVRHKFNCIEKHMRRSAVSFAILTDEVIRQEPRLKNLRWIYHLAPRITPTQIALQQALNRNIKHFPMSIKAADALLKLDSCDPYSMLLSGLLHCELDTEADFESTLKLSTEANHGWFWIAKEYGF